VRIWTTADGGATWQQSYSTTNGADSLMAAFAVSATEYWVGGGNLQTFTGAAYHSTDAGKTWTIQNVCGVGSCCNSLILHSHFPKWFDFLVLSIMLD
jgi:photosystem II stability/assembly factor-like uncharacterized protein